MAEPTRHRDVPKERVLEMPLIWPLHKTVRLQQSQKYPLSRKLQPQLFGNQFLHDFGGAAADGQDLGVTVEALHH